MRPTGLPRAHRAAQQRRLSRAYRETQQAKCRGLPRQPACGRGEPGPPAVSPTSREAGAPRPTPQAATAENVARRGYCRRVPTRADVSGHIYRSCQAVADGLLPRCWARPNRQSEPGACDDATRGHLSKGPPVSVSSEPCPARGQGGFSEDQLQAASGLGEARGTDEPGAVIIAFAWGFPVSGGRRPVSHQGLHRPGLQMGPSAGPASSQRPRPGSALRRTLSRGTEIGWAVRFL